MMFTITINSAQAYWKKQACGDISAKLYYTNESSLLASMVPWRIFNMKPFYKKLFVVGKGSLQIMYMVKVFLSHKIFAIDNMSCNHNLCQQEYKLCFTDTNVPFGRKLVNFMCRYIFFGGGTFFPLNLGYIYIYIYICICMCMCMCGCVASTGHIRCVSAHTCLNSTNLWTNIYTHTQPRSCQKWLKSVF